MIYLEDVTLGFDDKILLHLKHLEIQASERVAVMGPSGCGKSTLLRAIAGLDAPLEGAIYLDGQCASKGQKIIIPPHRRGIGMVFQDLALWPHMRVGENILFGLKMQGIGRDIMRERLLEMLALVGLSGYEDRFIASLSGGERQRVAVARALIQRAKILLMDEPLSSLDAKNALMIQHMLLDLYAKFGFTLVYVTHSKQEARRVASRIIDLGDLSMV